MWPNRRLSETSNEFPMGLAGVISVRAKIQTHFFKEANIQPKIFKLFYIEKRSADHWRERNVLNDKSSLTFIYQTFAIPWCLHTKYGRTTKITGSNGVERGRRWPSVSHLCVSNKVEACHSHLSIDQQAWFLWIANSRYLFSCVGILTRVQESRTAMLAHGPQCYTFGLIRQRTFR